MRWIHSSLGICTVGALIFACAQTGHVGDEVPNDPAPPLVSGADAGADAIPDDANGCAACPAMAFCERGSCRCPVGHGTVCSNTCVDLESDDSNCGACGHACGPVPDAGGPLCRAGICRVPESFPIALGKASALLADDQSIYVFGRSHDGGYEMVRAPKTQLSAFTKFAHVPEINSEATYTAAALAGGDVYMASFMGIFRAPKATGAVQKISNEGVLSFAVTATHLYVGGYTSVFRMTLPDGVLEPYLDFPASHLAVRGDALYVAKYVGYPPVTPAEIVHVDLSTKATTVIGATTCVTGLAALEDGLLWASGLYVDLAPDYVYGERKLLRWTKSTAKLSMLHQNPYAPVTGVATEGKNAYFTNGYYWRFDENAHALAVMALSGELPRSVNLATALQPVTALTPAPADGRDSVEQMNNPLVDGDSVYWLDFVELNGARLRRISIR